MIKFLEFCHDFSSECSHNQLCVVVFVVYNDVTYCVSEVHNLLEKDALFIVLVYTTTFSRLSALIWEVLQFQRLKLMGQLTHKQFMARCSLVVSSEIKQTWSQFKVINFYFIAFHCNFKYESKNNLKCNRRRSSLNRKRLKKKLGWVTTHFSYWKHSVQMKRISCLGCP